MAPLPSRSEFSAHAECAGHDREELGLVDQADHLGGLRALGGDADLRPRVWGGPRPASSAAPGGSHEDEAGQARAHDGAEHE